MNEELKIIIKAVTDQAKKSVKDVNDEIQKLGKNGKNTSGGFSNAMSKIGNAAKMGAKVVAGAFVAVSTALVALGKSTQELQKNQAQLMAAFGQAGFSAKNATDTYKELYGVIGDDDQAVESAANIAMLASSEKDAAKWAELAAGVVGTFHDTLQPEAFYEAANETLKLNQATGAFTQMLEQTGVMSVDAFNARLQQCTTMQEKNAFMLEVSNAALGTAGELYRKNAADMIASNQAQANLNVTLSNVGRSVMPLVTAFTNLSNALLTALAPAISFITSLIVPFINAISQAVQWVASFMGVLGGSNKSVNAMQQMATASKGIAGASKGAGALQKGLEGTAKAAEKVKRATAGFDELNVLSSGASSSGGGGSTPTATGGGVGGGGAIGAIDTSALDEGITESESKLTEFINRIKTKAKEFTQLFAPSAQAWSSAFSTIANAWEPTKQSLLNGVTSFYNGFMDLGTYLLTSFIPDVVNSFSVNLAPLFTDVLAFAMQEFGERVEFVGQIFNNVVNDIIIPVFEVVKGVVTDVFTIIGNAWEEHGEPFLTQLGAFFDNIRNTFTMLYKTVILPIWNNIIAVFKKVWDEGLKPLVDKAVNAALEIGECILQLYNEFVQPIVEWLIKNILPKVVNFINNVIKVVGNILTPIANTIGGVIDFIKGLIQFITGVFTGDWEKAWEGIKNMFKGVWDAICGIAKTAWEIIKGVFSVVGSFFQACWDSIKAVFAGVASWFGGIFTSAWNAIKKAFSAVGSFFDGVWTNIKNIFSKVGSTIGSAVSGAFSKAINTVLSKAISIINGFIKSINAAIGVINAIPGVNISKLKLLDVPKLAKGGIVTGSVLANIGEKGKEAVLPLENNTEWMDKLAQRLSDANKGPSKISLVIDGKELGIVTVNAINNITKQTGTMPLVLA